MVLRASCAFALIVASAASAFADEFAWSAPTSCPEIVDVRARIAHRLGGTDDGTDDIEVSVTRPGDRFVARITTATRSIRTLTSARCDELADAVAVIVARLATEAHNHRAVHVAIAPPPAAPHAIAAQRSVVVTPTLSRWGGGGRLLGLSGIGVVPNVGLGGELSGFARRLDTFVELGVALWGIQPAYVVAGAPGRVEVGVRMATLRVGWAPRAMPLRAWLGAELGAWTGGGVALQDARGGSGRWTAITSGLGVAWPISDHTRIVGTFEVAVALARAHFALADGFEIYQTSPMSARCALGIELGWR